MPYAQVEPSPPCLSASHSRLIELVAVLAVIREG